MAGNAIKAGAAYIEVFLKSDRFAQNSRNLTRTLKRVTAGVAALATAATAAGVALGAIAAAQIVKATKSFGDFEETLSKFNTVFGAQSDMMREWALNLATVQARTREEVMRTAATFQDFLQPMGMAADEARKLSRDLTELAGDLASFNNVSIEDAAPMLMAM